jgi:tripartite-type tricarboxylate transporter receptor subunit TctC
MRVRKLGQFDTLRRAILCILALAGIVSASLEPVDAEKQPARPVVMIVPFPAGGPTDMIARLLVDRLTSSLGQPVLVENHPGGSAGSEGVKAASAAAPDGQTLLFGSPGPLAIAPAVYPDSGTDPAKLFTPVAMVATSPHVLVVSPQIPARSVHDLIAYAKANPGRVKYASPGYGTQPHLLGELLNKTAALNLVHVPYEGSAPAIADLIAGRVQVFFSGPAAVAPYIADGRLHALAVASESRTRLLPNVPTMIESGLGRFIAYYWSGVVAPIGTPPQVVGRINGAINDALRDSEVQAGLNKLGAEPKIGTPQDAAAFIAAEAQKWAVVARAAGVIQGR